MWWSRPLEFDFFSEVRASPEYQIAKHGKVLYERTQTPARPRLAHSKPAATTSAHVLAAQVEPLLDTAVYHCQQAGEKAVKAFLTFHDCEFERIHDVERLAFGHAV